MLFMLLVSSYVRVACDCCVLPSQITLPLMEQLNVHVKGASGHRRYTPCRDHSLTVRALCLPCVCVAGVRRDLQIADGLFENAFRQARSLDKIVNLVVRDTSLLPPLPACVPPLVSPSGCVFGGCCGAQTDNSVGQLRLKWRRFKVRSFPAPTLRENCVVRAVQINTAPALLRVLAVVFGILSALVVWCEVRSTSAYQCLELSATKSGLLI